MSYYSRSAPNPTFPLAMGLAMLPLFMIIFDDDPLLDTVRDYNTQKIAAMTATDEQSAVNLGMYQSLAPYFAACQQEYGITAGVTEGVTITKADAMLECMESREDNDEPGADVSVHTPNDGEKWNTLLKVSMSAPDADFAYNLGMITAEAKVHFEGCQAEHGITAGNSNGVTYEQADAMAQCLTRKVQP